MSTSERATASIERSRMISDEEVDKALSWLRDNAKTLGDAKAETVRCGHMIKHVKALVMKMHNEIPFSGQEREALASDRYVQALEADAVAAGEYEKLRALREAAALKIEAWRTEQSNFRAMKL